MNYLRFERIFRPPRHHYFAKRINKKNILVARHACMHVSYVTLKNNTDKVIKDKRFDAHEKCFARYLLCTEFDKTYYFVKIELI